MSSFTDLIVKALPDGIRWELMTPFTYHVGDEHSLDKIEVPAGFVTDFGSVPTILHPVVSPQGKAKGAFVLHDWLYYTGQRSRLVSDAILMEALEVCKVNRFQRWLIFRGVRMGGWVAWKGHRREQVAKEGAPAAD